MPRVDRSTTILTGMIIAALYVILLVGFARESYMHRDAAARHADGAGGWPATHDILNRVYRIEPPRCRANESILSSRPPGERRAMRDDP